MIKTGILGADSLQGGELIRILINHPEVDMVSVVAPALKGKSVTEIHAGLIGDTKLKFSHSVDYSNIDVLFIAGSFNDIDHGKIVEINPALKIINLCPGLLTEGQTESQELKLITAISELFRKPMVRGNKYAKVYDPALTAALIALGPLALHLVLTEDITLNIKKDPNLFGQDYTNEYLENFKNIIRNFQKSFSGNVIVSNESSEDPRCIRVRIDMKNSIPLQEIKRMYDDIYDDHNFTFIVDKPATFEEVRGTQKCIINVGKPTEDTLTLTAVVDGKMRGGAGDAVHAMNLMFGLYEKIGLTLKPYCF